MTRPNASVSLDADNLWSYLKTRGDDSWRTRPSYLPVLEERMLSLWQEMGIQGTLFVVGFDAARPDGASLVSSTHHEGHEVANHSYEHEPWLHLYGREQLISEMQRTEDAIVAAGAPRPVGFRGPGYSLSPDLVDILQQRGYEYDCSTLPTWIGPLARSYYFRQARLSKEEQQERALLFGRATEGLRPNTPYRWSPVKAGNPSLLELPVTTMPFARVPIHLSYLITAYMVNPALGRIYQRAALRICRLSKTGPSILMHPLDLIDTDDAPGLEFFPAAQYPAQKKTDIARRLLADLSENFTLTGTRAHAQAVGSGELPTKSPHGLEVKQV